MSSELIHRNQTRDQSENQTTDSSLRRENSPPRTRTNMLVNRVPFLLIGIAISTFFFHYLPSRSTLPQNQDSSSLVETELTLPTRRVLLEEHGRDERKRRVPLAVGLKSKRQKRVLVTGGAGFVGSHLVDRLIERGDNVIVIDNYFTGRKENVVHHIGNPNFELIRHDVVEPILLEVDQIYHLACPASPVHYKFNPVKTIISFFLIYFICLLIYILHDWHFWSKAYVCWVSDKYMCMTHVIILLHIFFSNYYHGRHADPCLWNQCFLLSHFDKKRYVIWYLIENFGSLILIIWHKTNVVGTLNMLGLAKRVGARFLLTSTSEVYGDPLQHPQAETYWGNVNPIGNNKIYFIKLFWNLNCLDYNFNFN